MNAYQSSTPSIFAKLQSLETNLRSSRFANQIFLFLLLIGMQVGGTSPLAAFDFKAELFGPPKTLGASVQTINPVSGEVIINGGDSAEPSIPFDVDWGDGTPAEQVWFPFQHTYTQTTLNYIVQIVAHYDGGATDNIVVPVRFAPPVLTPLALPPERAVFIDSSLLSLVSRPYPGYSAPVLSYFGVTFFDLVPRSAIEYVLHLAAELQYSIADGDVLEVGGGFQQHALRDSGFGGMYSIWYTEPVAFGAGDYAFAGTIQYSSFFHEMGHNVTLNFPASFHYGGRIDGAANAIFSETMAQIFQHYTAYVMLNDYISFGLEDTLALEIELSARSSMRIVRDSYDEFIANGAPFTSWNNPATPEDETFGTFMTLAYKFFEHAENNDAYVLQLFRLMKLFALFNADLASQYGQHDNTIEAETFRSTLMVAALSYASDSDLRSEMQALNFPIDDDRFDQLLQDLVVCEPQMSLACSPDQDPQSLIDGLNVQINGGVFAPEPCEPVAKIQWDWGDGTSTESWFPASHTYPAFENYVITATALDDSDVMIISASCEMPLDDIYENRWKLVNTNEALSRKSHSLVYDSARKVFVLFGGRNFDPLPLSDTWEYNGRFWSQIATDNSPLGRFWHAMVYDSNRQRVVLFGGGDPDNSIYFNDTWEYDGSNWQLVSTPHSPPPAIVKTMVFDSARNKTVLVLGDAQSETWEYDGSDWTSIDAPAAPPPPGPLAAMAYDAARGRTVLTIYDGTPQLATWEYDGSTWAEVDTPHSPLGRWAHAMTYDACRQLVVLYGGYSPYQEGGSDIEDTWEYDGSDWVRIITPESAGQMQQHAMDFDSDNCRVILNLWGETWIYPKLFEMIFKNGFEG